MEKNRTEMMSPTAQCQYEGGKLLISVQ